MGHVAPHLWGDLRAGKLAPRRAAAIESHADSCDRCGRQRARIDGAVDQFEGIAAAEIDDLAWDEIGARIYWAESLERRTAEREIVRPRRSLSWILAPAIAAAGAALIAWWVTRPDPAQVMVVIEPPQAPPKTRINRAVAVELAPATEVAAIAVLARGDVSVDGAPLDWSRSLGSGARIETGDGAAAVFQLGAGTGISLGANTTLALGAFDNHQIELILEAGVIDALVSPRRPSEQLAVVSGGRSVVVRGTGFQVRRDGARLEVRCEHGRVELTDGTTSRSVGATRRAAIADHDDLADGVAIAAIEPAELETLTGRLAMPLLPTWSEADAALAASGPVSVEADPETPVSIDGESRGTGAVTVRLPAGRHEIAVGDHPEWGAGKWLTVEAGGEARVHARREPPSRTAPDRSRRRAELRRAVATSAALDRCIRPLQKQGVAAGSYAVFDIGVNADGSLRFASVARSNLGLEARRCLLDAVGKIRFPPGAAAGLSVRWSHRSTEQAESPGEAK